MRLAIVHLSDMHVKSPTDPLLQRGAAIASALRSQIRGETAVLVVLSGDVAYSGLKPEYKAAHTFLDEILKEIEQIPKVSILGTVITPGNHDCDFSNEGDARPGLLKVMPGDLENYDLAGESMRQLLRVHEEFFRFAHALLGRQIPTQERVSSHLRFSCDGKQIEVLLLNTALFSKLPEVVGQLYLPPKAISPDGCDADFSLTVLHHPYSWLDPENARDTRRRIESVSDLVLTGHEHDGDSYARIDRAGDETGYVEGMALQAKGPTGFNLVLVDLETETNQVYRYSWCDDIYQPDPAKAYVFARKQSLIRAHFENNPEFSRSLNDLGRASFTLRSENSRSRTCSFTLI